jgi:iron(III) transport system ATP-binding protein
MYLQLEKVSKVFASRGGIGEVVAVDHVDLNIQEGELVTLLGPSGCGKTTTLRMVAGFEFPTSGDIFLDGENINTLPPHERNMSMVFQSYAIFPHLNVYENIAYGLKVQKRPKQEIDKRVERVLDLVELPGFQKRAPNQLSGGQQQRVALARALIMEPKVLLMDEPLSNLDAKLRELMRTEIRRIQKYLGITSVYVTHDQAEAMTISDWIVVMNEGKIEQIGTPIEVYRSPVSRFVADFIGRTNFVDGRVVSTNADHLVVEMLGQPLTIPLDNRTFEVGEQVTVIVRPEMISIDSGEPHTTGLVTQAAYLGNHIEYVVDVEDQTLALIEGDPQRMTVHPEGTKVGLRLIEDCLYVLPKTEKKGRQPSPETVQSATPAQ